MIYVFLADGFEETEAMAPIDILRRAEKEVITVGIGKEFIDSSHGVCVQADVLDRDIILSDMVEMIVLPGGMPGTLNLEKDPYVKEAIEYCSVNNKFIGAICAAPSILGKLGLLKEKEAICFPGFEDFLDGAVLSEKKVCTDGNIITAKGAGVAIDFGLELVKVLCGEAKSRKIRAALQCD